MMRLFCVTAIAVSLSLGAIARLAPRPSLPQVKVEETEDVRLMVIERIQSQSKLISATGTFSNQIDLSKKRSLWIIPLGSQSLTYQAVGEVSLGYDLSKLTPESVQWADAEGANGETVGSIVIMLPPLEIISVKIDPQESRPMTSQSIPPEMVQQALQAGEASFKAIVCSTDTPTTARDQARSDVTSWLSMLEGEGIKVRVQEATGGVCEGAIAQDVSNGAIEYQEPEMGDPIGDLVVTSDWGPRTFQGKEDYHYGLDLALPGGQDSTGTPVYAIGAPGESVEVLCWNEPIAGNWASWGSTKLGYGFDYGHLESCIPGKHFAGDKIGTIGNTGVSTTGAHLHIQQRKGGTTDPKTGEHEPVSKTFAQMAVTGNPPL